MSSGTGYDDYEERGERGGREGRHGHGHRSGRDAGRDAARAARAGDCSCPYCGSALPEGRALAPLPPARAERDPLAGALAEAFGPFRGFLDPFSICGEMLDFDRQFRQMDEIFGRPQFGDWDVEPPEGGPAPGGPQYYVSSTTSTVLPGGVCETRRRVRRNGLETEEHSRAIGDRRVVQKRERDLATGREDRRRDIYHMQEGDLDAFDREFQRERGRAADSWWGRALGGPEGERGRGARGDRQLAGPEGM